MLGSSNPEAHPLRSDVYLLSLPTSHHRATIIVMEPGPPACLLLNISFFLGLCACVLAFVLSVSIPLDLFLLPLSWVEILMLQRTPLNRKYVSV